MAPIGAKSDGSVQWIALQDIAQAQHNRAARHAIRTTWRIAGFPAWWARPWLTS